MSDLLDLLGEVGRTLPARDTDPATSHAGAQHIAVKAGTLRARLLATYAIRGALTDDEAGDFAGIRTGYWKRCSELRDAAYIAPTGDTRPSFSGVEAMVCAITDAGREVLGGLS